MVSLNTRLDIMYYIIGQGLGGPRQFLDITLSYKLNRDCQILMIYASLGREGSSGSKPSCLTMWQ